MPMSARTELGLVVLVPVLPPVAVAAPTLVEPPLLVPPAVAAAPAAPPVSAALPPMLVLPPPVGDPEQPAVRSRTANDTGPSFECDERLCIVTTTPNHARVAHGKRKARETERFRDAVPKNNGRRIAPQSAGCNPRSGRDTLMS